MAANTGPDVAEHGADRRPHRFGTLARSNDLYGGGCARRCTPDAFAVRDAVRRLTYRELIDAADCLAGDLAAKGVRPGQRLAVWLPSRVETAIAVLACSRNAYVCCPSLHRDHTVADVRSLLERMRAAALIAQVAYGADGERHDVFAMAADLPFIRAIYHADAVWCGPSVIGPPSHDPNRVMYLPFTSGTTGEPKGVMHSDNTLLANARVLAADWAFGHQSVIYTFSPLSHNLGFGAMIAALAVGGELVVHDLPRGDSLLDRLVETGATFLFGVPTHAIDLPDRDEDTWVGHTRGGQGFPHIRRGCASLRSG